LAGTLRFVGTVQRDIVVLNEVSANSRAAGWNMELAFSPGVKGVVNSTTRCGSLIVESGILEVLPYNNASFTIRVAGTDYTAQPGNGVSDGLVLIKSGATLISGNLYKNTTTGAGNTLASFTIESGGECINCAYN